MGQMRRSEIIELAKHLVASHGPANCLEFTSETVENELAGTPGYNTDDWYGRIDQAPDFKPLYQEVRKQAGRVYAFLGYENPENPESA